jgi:hypothetical protein
MKGVSRSTWFALLLAAGCTTRPLHSGRNDGTGGINLTGTDAGGVDAAQASDAPQGRDAQRERIALDAAEFLACASDDDCVVTWYPQPVMSVEDCYCGFCAVLPLNKTTDALFAAEWNQYCKDWVKTANCPILPCFAPPKVRCVSGFCRAGMLGQPSICPIDTSGECANAVACAGICCAPGEWCDSAIGCRCGYGLACPVGQTCGRAYWPPSSPPDLCGDVCCFDCAP